LPFFGSCGTISPETPPRCPLPKPRTLRLAMPPSRWRFWAARTGRKEHGHARGARRLVIVARDPCLVGRVVTSRRLDLGGRGRSRGHRLGGPRTRSTPHRGSFRFRLQDEAILHGVPRILRFTSSQSEPRDVDEARPASRRSSSAFWASASSNRASSSTMRSQICSTKATRSGRGNSRIPGGNVGCGI